jgi:NADH-quinone oxidoreductase subunit J
LTSGNRTEPPPALRQRRGRADGRAHHAGDDRLSIRALIGFDERGRRFLCCRRLSIGLPDILFYVFAFLTLVCGALVVANPFSRNPVTSAMFLVLTIISLAGLFVLLHAFFLAAVQVLVYAGAVMVLFLFVIMLLDLKAEERRKVKKLGLTAGLVSIAAIVGIFLKSLRSAAPGQDLPGKTAIGDTARLGRLLFTNYLLPFEIVSVLLLVAMVGVILLSKKDLK